MTVVGVGSGLHALSSIENVTGSAFGDSITGGNRANRLTGLASADTILGNGGFDFLDGGEGSDTITGGLGNDTLTGGSGADHFRHVYARNASINVDTITDFASGSDVIALGVDLRGVQWPDRANHRHQCQPAV